MCVTSHLHGESFEPKQEIKGGQGDITLRSFHTKKKKETEAKCAVGESSVQGCFKQLFFIGYRQTCPRQETMLLDMWNTWYVNVGPSVLDAAKINALLFDCNSAYI